jgi:hypothetical protein
MDIEESMDIEERKLRTIILYRNGKIRRCGYLM